MSDPGEADLGKVVRVHRSVEKSMVRGLAAMIFVPLLACLVVMKSGWLISLGAIGLAGLALWIVAATVGRRGPTLVEVHEHGLVKRFGDAAVAVRWDDILSVTLDPMKTRFGMRLGECVVEARQGLVVSLPLAMTEGQKFLETIVESTHERLLNDALARCKEGGEVAFGPFVVSLKGIRTGESDVVPWTKIERVLAVGPRIEVFARDRTQPIASTRLATVPNAAVLTQISRLVRAEPDAPRA